MNSKYICFLVAAPFIGCVLLTSFALQSNKTARGKQEMLEFKQHQINELQTSLDKERAVRAKTEELFLDVWWGAYTQAVIDAHFKVPQIIVQKDGDKFGIWRKSVAFDDPDANNLLMPDQLPALAPLPEKSTASAKKR